MLHADLVLWVSFSCQRSHLFSYIPSILCLHVVQYLYGGRNSSPSGNKYTDSWLLNCYTGSHIFIYLFTASGHMDIRWTDRFTVLGFICSPHVIYAGTRTCILSVIQCSAVSLLLKCNFSSSLQSVFLSWSLRSANKWRRIALTMISTTTQGVLGHQLYIFRSDFPLLHYGTIFWAKLLSSMLFTDLFGLRLSYFWLDFSSFLFILDSQNQKSSWWVHHRSNPFLKNIHSGTVKIYKLIHRLRT